MRLNVMADRPTIRPLRATDYDALRGIADAPPEGFASHLHAACSFVAELHGTPIAFLLAQPLAYHDGAPLTLWIDDIAVHPDYRRRGVAAALYRDFGAWAHAAGATALLARVDPDDPAALALHRRAGFVAHTPGTVIRRLDRARSGPPAASTGHNRGTAGWTALG